MVHKNYEAMRAEVSAAVNDAERRHFLDYHINNHNDFARDLIELLCVLDDLSPSAGRDVVKKIGALKGKDHGTFDQIVQVLCELVIAKRFIESFPPQDGFKLHWEPTENTKANPEFMVVGPDWRLLVEVKCPSLRDYSAKNRTASTQLAARLPGMKKVIANIAGEDPALPLDNKIKDFLVSAERKFSSFGEAEVPTHGLLVICWTQRMFEAVSPLSNEGCGLLTENSFYEESGTKVQFPHVSGIVTTQHQSFLHDVLIDEHLPGHIKSGLDYGEYWLPNTPPNPVYSPNPFAVRQLPDAVIEKLQAVRFDEGLDAIARPMDFVMWMPGSGSRRTGP